MNAGFVKIRRGVIDHVRDGNLSVSEFAVFQLLILLADSSTGAQTINAAVLRSCYFQDMTRDTAQRTLSSLETKGFIFRINPASSRRAYRYVVNKYEATTGPNRLRRTDLSQVFLTQDINDVRWVECATGMSAGMSAGIPTGMSNSNKKEEIEKEELSSSPGRENGPLALDHPVIHEMASLTVSENALPEEPFSLTSSSPPVLPPASAAAPRARPKIRAKAADPRSEQFKAAIENDWKKNNPDLPLLWGVGEGAALKKLLSAGKLSLERFESCLANRSRSENPDANRGNRPRRFLPNILSYSSGPLDRFGHLKTLRTPVSIAPSGQKSIAQQNTEYLQNKAALLKAEGGTKVAHA